MLALATPAPPAVLAGIITYFVLRLRNPDAALFRAAIAATIMTMIAIIGPAFDLTLDLSFIARAFGDPDAKLALAGSSAKLGELELSALVLLDLVLFGAAIYKHNADTSKR
jgi:hypothetical protein